MRNASPIAIPAPRPALHAIPPVRFPRPVRRRAPHNRRAVVAFTLAVVAIGVLGLIGSRHMLESSPMPATGESEAALYGGTILLAPSRQNRCRRMSFDNREGRLRDDGTIACGEAAAEASALAERPGARNVDLVREGFRNRR